MCNDRHRSRCYALSLFEHISGSQCRQLTIQLICVVVVNSFLGLHVFGDVAVANAAVLKANRVWLFSFGPGPVFCVALLLWRRNASLAGGFAGRPVVWCCFVCVVVGDRFALWHRPIVLGATFHCLCLFQDRATVHLRPNSRKKKHRGCFFS